MKVMRPELWISSASVFLDNISSASVNWFTKKEDKSFNFIVPPSDSSSEKNLYHLFFLANCQKWGEKNREGQVIG